MQTSQGTSPTFLKNEIACQKATKVRHPFTKKCLMLETRIQTDLLLYPLFREKPPDSPLLSTNYQPSRASTGTGGNPELNYFQQSKELTKQNKELDADLVTRQTRIRADIARQNEIDRRRRRLSESNK